jgi:hypothetical protein
LQTEYTFSFFTTGSALTNGQESAEIELDIRDGMTEKEVRDVIQSVLKAEYLKGVSYKKKVGLEHKIGRFFIRAVRGVACGYEKGMRFRWFTFTESDKAIENNIDFGKAFHKFITRLRYHCPDFQYIVIEHRQGDMLRRNWHVLSYGSDKFPLDDMDAWWKANFKSMITGMEEIRNINQALKYVAGYLAEPEKFIRSFFSQGWVFSGWVGISWHYRKKYGEYLSEKDLKELSLMSPDQRKYELEWLINTGYLSAHYDKELNFVSGS